MGLSAFGLRMCCPGLVDVPSWVCKCTFLGLQMHGHGFAHVSPGLGMYRRRLTTGPDGPVCWPCGPAIFILKTLRHALDQSNRDSGLIVFLRFGL